MKDPGGVGPAPPEFAAVGRRTFRGNATVERLLRSSKYEQADLDAHDSVAQAGSGVRCFIDLYNTGTMARPHFSLNKC